MLADQRYEVTHPVTMGLVCFRLKVSIAWCADGTSWPQKAAHLAGRAALKCGRAPSHSGSARTLLVAAVRGLAASAFAIEILVTDTPLVARPLVKTTIRDQTA